MACILITDDDEILRQMLRKILTKNGHTVLEAPDGNVSLQLCRREKVDLVITDIVMPDKDGIELIRAIRLEHPGLKIICISGGGLIDKNIYLTTARRLGAHVVLSKPFTIDEMVAKVNDLLLAA